MDQLEGVPGHNDDAAAGEASYAPVGSTAGACRSTKESHQGA